MIIFKKFQAVSVTQSLRIIIVILLEENHLLLIGTVSNFPLHQEACVLLGVCL